MKQEVLGVKAPKSKGTVPDKKCPFYGEISVKKELVTGTVVKRDTSRSATIEWSKSRYVPKYERYKVNRFRLRVHNPASIDAQIGQKVLAARTRPLSKTKNHVIIKVLSDDSTKKASDNKNKKNNQEK